MRTVVLRVAALALLLLLALVATLTVRTLNRLPDTTLYLVRADERSFTLEPVRRRLGSGDRERWAVAAVAALAAAPDAEARAHGLASEVPPDTRALAARYQGGLLTVELSPAFAAGGGSASMLGRLHQLLWTLTEPADVERVALELGGAPLRLLGGEGVIVPHPWRRPDDAPLPVW